jgi:hypothetical protein
VDRFFTGSLERMEMFALQLRHLADVMPFA